MVEGVWSLASESLDVGFLGKGKIHIWLRPSGYRLLVESLPSDRAVITISLETVNTVERELWKELEVLRAERNCHRQWTSQFGKFVHVFH